jgi:hypothetical protein
VGHEWCPFWIKKIGCLEWGLILENIVDQGIVIANNDAFGGLLGVTVSK